MGVVIWKLLRDWEVSQQVARECEWVDELLGVEDEGELAPVIPLRG